MNVSRREIWLVMTTAFASRAAEKILLSVACWRPSHSSEKACTPKVLLSQGASAGESCTSIQNFMRQLQDG